MVENRIDELKDAICELVNLAEDADITREVFETLDNAGTDIIDCLDELDGYRAIGTVEKFKALKLKEHKCEDCAGCTAWNADCANIREKAIDEFEKEIVADYDNDGCPGVADYLDYKISIRDLFKIAEQLKGE